MKNSSLGWPWSDNKKRGLEKDVSSCISRAEAETLTFWK